VFLDVEVKVNGKRVVTLTYRHKCNEIDNIESATQVSNLNIQVTMKSLTHYYL